MTRAVIYARFSSENQSENSIDDQIEVCRRMIDKEGWSLVETYQDAAISGASRFRLGFQQLIADAESSKFDIVVCEALDRLARRLSDIADLYDRLSFHNVKLYATSTGEISAIHIGVARTMAQLYLSDLREKTWRGQLGRARAGKLPGGHAFGYDLVPAAEGSDAVLSGERRINPMCPSSK